MAYVIDCVDSMQVRGETMDELRRNAEKHVAEYHRGEDLDLEAIMATAREE
jgi:tRNA A37 threonylcarbamoyladenosine dehydratase